MTLPVKYILTAVSTVLILSVAGIVVLATQDKSIPDVLQNLATGALTGLLGLLVHPGSQEEVSE